MNILIVAPDFKPNVGGIAQVSWHLANQMHLRGHHVAVLAHGTNNTEIESSFSITRVLMHSPQPERTKIELAFNMIRYLIKSAKALNTVTRSFKPDICLLTNYTDVTARLLLGRNYPVALFLHGEEISILAHTRSWARFGLFKKFLKRADHIFVNSTYSRAELNRIDTAAYEKAIAVGCGTDIVHEPESRQVCRQKLGWDNSPRIITICRLVERKGIDMIIKAMPAILQIYPDAKYIIAGDGEDRPRLELIAAENNVTQSVIFEGKISDSRKKLLLTASDIFAMISRPGIYGEVEGFGIGFLEANAMGLPVIGSRCGGITDAVEDGVNGLLVDPQDFRQVAKASLELLAKPELRQQYAAAGVNKIKERYNWASISDAVLAKMQDKQA